MTVPGISIIGAKSIVIMINGSLLIAVKRGSKPDTLKVSAIIMNRKFKPINVSKLKPNALPNPILINLFFTILFSI